MVRALTLPPDLGESAGVVVQDGCEIEGVGYYETDGSLKVAKAVFKAFSPTDQAAFILHEAFYKSDRLFEGATDSSNARHVNAALFSISVDDNGVLQLVLPVFGLVADAWGPGRLFDVILDSPLEIGTQIDFLAPTSLSYNFYDGDECWDYTAGRAYGVNSLDGPGLSGPGYPIQALSGNHRVQLYPTPNDNCIKLTFMVEIASPSTMGFQFSQVSSGAVYYSGQAQGTNYIQVALNVAVKATVAPIPIP